MSEQEQFEFSLRLVEEQERKANQFIQKASTQQSLQQQQQQQPGPTHNQLQSKELSTISEKTECSYTTHNQFHAAASNTTVTSPIFTNEKTTSKALSLRLWRIKKDDSYIRTPLKINYALLFVLFNLEDSKGTSVTKSIRNLDNNRFLDTSTGISDAFSVRNNPTPNSTPQQLMSPDSRFSDRNNMTNEENFYEAANNTTPTSRHRNMFNNNRQPTNTNQSRKQVASGRNHSANNMGKF